MNEVTLSKKESLSVYTLLMDKKADSYLFPIEIELLKRINEYLDSIDLGGENNE